MQYSTEILSLAENEILDIFNKINKPLLVSDLLKKIGYDCLSALLSAQIGDGQGAWNNGPHKQALGILVDNKKISWWIDQKDYNWYSLKGQENQKAIQKAKKYRNTVTKFLEKIGKIIDKPINFHEYNTIEIDNTNSELTLSIDDMYGDEKGNLYKEPNTPRKQLVLEFSDLVCGSVEGEIVKQWNWPQIKRKPNALNLIANTITKALKKEKKEKEKEEAEEYRKIRYTKIQSEK